jgi:hypothetical protein
VIAVIFEVLPNTGGGQEYLDVAANIVKKDESMDS